MTTPTAPASPLPAAPPAAERARLAVSAVFLINGTLFATWAVNIPGVKTALHLTEAQLGTALLAVGIGSLMSMPLTGGWIARRGSQWVTALLSPLTMLALLPPFFMPSLWPLTAALGVLGALNGALDVAMNAQGVSVEKALARPVMSRLHAYFSLGGVVGAVLGTGLVGRVPMLAHVGGVALLSTLTALMAGRFLLPDESAVPEQVSEQLPQRGSEQGPEQAPEHVTAQTKGDTPRPGVSPATLLLGGLCFLGMLSEGAHYDWAALYFRDVLGLPGGQAGVGYAAFVGTMTLGRWFGDHARTRFGDEVMVRAGALLSALGLGLALLSRDPLPATLGFALSGLGLSNVVPVMYGAAGHALHGRGIAQVATIGYGGFLLGPPLIGFLAQHFGLPASLGLAVAGSALVAVLGGLAFGLIRRSEGRS